MKPLTYIYMGIAIVCLGTAIYFADKQTDFWGWFIPLTILFSIAANDQENK